MHRVCSLSWPSSPAAPVPILPFPSSPHSAAAVGVGPSRLTEHSEGRAKVAWAQPHPSWSWSSAGGQGSTPVGFRCTFLLVMPYLRFLHPGPGFIEHHVFSMFLNKN